MKIPFDIFYIYYLLEHTQFGIKIFEVDLVMEI